jgi:type VI secretion system protein VasG
MSEISRSSSFGKLNSVAFKAIESATVFCKLRGNPYVELVHWISQILQSPDSDLHRIIRSIGCRVARRPSRTSPRTSKRQSSGGGSTPR